MDVFVRHEHKHDQTAIRLVNRAAFEGEEESRLVDALRGSGDVRLSLVAVKDTQVIGHILFSEMWIDSDEQTVKTLALAPMSVLPEHQRQGVGSLLVRRGLELCAEAGYHSVLVVGHPEYYPRFGFSRDPVRYLDSPYQGDAFMALELSPKALANVKGSVRYPAPFVEL